MADPPPFDVVVAAAKKVLSLDALSETEQILYFATSKCSSAYEIHDRAGTPREDVARDILAKNYGPKFADRVLADQAYRKMLQVDEPPITGGTTTVETI